MSGECDFIAGLSIVCLTWRRWIGEVNASFFADHTQDDYYFHCETAHRYMFLCSRVARRVCLLALTDIHCTVCVVKVLYTHV